ncbi:hypothetical protein CLAIMM_14194 isoform 1, partial [Cladophialophora immunda]
RPAASCTNMGDSVFRSFAAHSSRNSGGQHMIARTNGLSALGKGTESNHQQGPPAPLTNPQPCLAWVLTGARSDAAREKVRRGEATRARPVQHARIGRQPALTRYPSLVLTYLEGDLLEADEKRRVV